MIVQELLERDYKTCVSCNEDNRQNVSANAVLITSNKAHFHFSGCVNQQNFPYWSENKPKTFGLCTVNK